MNLALLTQELVSLILKVNSKITCCLFQETQTALGNWFSAEKTALWELLERISHQQGKGRKSWEKKGLKWGPWKLILISSTSRTR